LIDFETDQKLKAMAKINHSKRSIREFTPTPTRLRSSMKPSVTEIEIYIIALKFASQYRDVPSIIRADNQKKSIRANGTITPQSMINCQSGDWLPKGTIPIPSEIGTRLSQKGT
jgi:hypothetical protein